MVGDTDDDIQERRRGGSGHRTVPHPADVRIEAWGASRERCLVEAALGMVECFADVRAVRPTSVEHVRLAEIDDDDLLSALLEEVVRRLEVDGRVPVDLEADDAEDGLEVRLALAGLSDVRTTGTEPRDVTWHGVRFAPDPYGWSCAVTVDV
ncbi:MULTISPECIES: archease [unclassified Streptomyces]|uniref:archease n=1 Tax=unclassified Streptomyces TaxID=2593676 RepID=UPI001F046159|nr:MULTISPECIES: archease [unclassified Streptomyces]MCH0562431.1 archease [Streptomyces sp. MUM 2J]MCH0570407.1 archease [Streptomyces sp. MUM 136J]